MISIFTALRTDREFGRCSMRLGLTLQTHFTYFEVAGFDYRIRLFYLMNLHIIYKYENDLQSIDAVKSTLPIFQ